MKGVIFDLDGVICFTDELHYRAWKTLADKLGIYFDRTINNRLRGVSRMASLDIILEKSEKSYTEVEKAQFAAQKNELYVKSLSSMGEKDVSEDVRFTLAELKRRGVKIAIGSSSKNTPVILKKIGLDKEFDAVSDGNNITKSKPNPEVFLKATEFLDEKPCDCMIVEDSSAGIDAGKLGGFVTVGIGEAAKYDKTDIAIEKLSDILKYV